MTSTVPKGNSFYTDNTDEECDEAIENYNAVLFTVCDAYGRPRGKFAVGDGIKRAVENGMEMPYTTCMQGFHSEVPTTIPRYKKTVSVTSRMVPDLSTLGPLSWLCKDGRKVGHVLCDLHTSNGEHDPSSPRQVAMRQIDSLKCLGFQILTAFETEYFVYEKGTLKEYGGPFPDVTNLINMDEMTPFFYDHFLSLIACRLPVETHMKEYAPGQIELSYKPQYGIKMADCVHRLRYLTKALCATNGLEPTFMTRPKSDFASSGYHFNHSLWTLDGKNAFYDPNDEHKCSEVLRHWTAGLILHGPALLALVCPTVNCYERLHNIFTPGDNNWNYNDKNARLRVKNKGKNIHIEDRTPSSACNSYLALAGLIAAGADGIERKLELPPARTFRPMMTGDKKSKAQIPLPKTLDEALLALEEDEILRKSLGEDFVQEYVALSKEFQIQKLKDIMDKTPDVRYEVERNLYLHSL